MRCCHMLMMMVTCYDHSLQALKQAETQACTQLHAHPQQINPALDAPALPTAAQPPAQSAQLELTDLCRALSTLSTEEGEADSVRRRHTVAFQDGEGTAGFGSKLRRAVTRVQSCRSLQTPSRFSASRGAGRTSLLTSVRTPLHTSLTPLRTSAAREARTSAGAAVSNSQGTSGMHGTGPEHDNPGAGGPQNVITSTQSRSPSSIGSFFARRKGQSSSTHASSSAVRSSGNSSAGCVAPSPTPLVHAVREGASASAVRIPDGVLWAHPGRGAPDSLRFLILRRFPFTSQEPRSTCVVQHPDGALAVYIKGAPEKVAELCDPSTVPDDFHAALHAASQPGCVVLGAAVKALDMLPSQLGWFSREALEVRGWSNQPQLGLVACCFWTCLCAGVHI